MMQIKYHKNLTLESWQKLSLAEQLAHIGAEVKRASFWREKDKSQLSTNALYRSLELFDLTLATLKSYPALKEIARAREVTVDYFAGDNQYHSTAENLNRYFYHFNLLASRKRYGIN